MKQWSLVYQGWHTNPRLAKADAEAKRRDAERVDWAEVPLEAFSTSSAPAAFILFV